jgi:hypothetical protein
MLMGFCTVDKDGELSIEGDLRVLYTAMMHIRMLIVKESGVATMLPIKMGLRYSAVRRQFKT